MIRKILAHSSVVLLLITSSVFADSPGLQNLSTMQADAVFKTFAAHLAFKPVEPPSAYGRFFGFSLGVIGTATPATDLPQKEVKYLPGGDLYLGLQLPMGIAAEFGMIPSVKVGGVKMSQYGGDLKWTINKAFFEASPVDFALRATYTTAKLKYTRTVSGGSMELDYSTKIKGANLSVGVPVVFVTPYVGLGFISEASTLNGSGATALFDRAYFATSSVKSNLEGLWLTAGAEFKFMISTFGLEYNRLFQMDTYSAKLGIKI